jgi:hypothetical protein
MSLDSNKLGVVLLGGKAYVDRDLLLDFLATRVKLTLEELRRKGTPQGDTEFLRGQSFEQEIIKDAIQSPKQTNE